MTIKENRAAWVAALRSGKYKQGTGYLCYIAHDGTLHYCCLGLMCDVMGFEAKRAFKTSDTDTQFIFGDWPSISSPGPAMQRSVGLRTEAGDFVVNELVHQIVPDLIVGDYASLINLNDRHRLSFARIADIIESEPEGLFKE